MSWEGADLNDFLWYLETVSDGATTGNIQELRGLMSSNPIDRKGGSDGGVISKQLIYGDKQMPDTQIKIERISESPNDFVRKQKEGRKFAKKNYQRREIGIKGAVNYLRILYKSILPFLDTDDFGDAIFYGSSAISNQI